MSLSVAPGSEARNNLRQNRFGRWHRRDEPVEFRMCITFRYEMVMNSARDVAWLENPRYAQGWLVNYIMDTFLKHYVA